MFFFIYFFLSLRKIKKLEKKPLTKSDASISGFSLRVKIIRMFCIFPYIRIKNYDQKQQNTLKSLKGGFKFSKSFFYSIIILILVFVYSSYRLYFCFCVCFFFSVNKVWYTMFICNEMHVQIAAVSIYLLLFYIF